MNRQQLHIYYSGRVQGVGFRYATRMLARGYEVTGAVRNLPEEVFFNVITFSNRIEKLSETAMEATQANKNKVYLAINDLEPKGATFTYGALDMAFQMAGRGLQDKFYDPGVDTICVLTDGAPTGGRRYDMSLMVDLLLERTRWRPVRFDPVLVSCPRGLQRHWERLARESGGAVMTLDFDPPEESPGGTGRKEGGGP